MTKPQWLILAGECMQLAGIIAVVAGLAFGLSHWRSEIPVVAGLIAFFTGRRLRKRTTT